MLVSEGQAGDSGAAAMSSPSQTADILIKRLKDRYASIADDVSEIRALFAARMTVTEIAEDYFAVPKKERDAFMRILQALSRH
jgi:hypothetical protein